MDSPLTENLPRMYRVALRILGDSEKAEDAVQNACVKALQNRDRFDGRASWTTWLHRITVNCCIDRMRNDDRARVRSFGPNEELAGMALYLQATPAMAAEWREMHEIASALVEALPHVQLCGPHVEDLTARMSHRRHLRAALRADSLVVGHLIELRHALEVFGQRGASGVTAAP